MAFHIDREVRTSARIVEEMGSGYREGKRKRIGDLRGLRYKNKC